jgi:hypothetical protein
MKNTVFSFSQKPKRWLALLLTVIALHVVFIEWMSGHMGFSGMRNSDSLNDSLITAILHEEAPPKAKVASLPPKPQARPPAPPPLPMQSAPETTATDPSPSPAVPTAALPDEVKTSDSATAAQSAASAPEAGLGTSVQPALRVDPPPSARLNYRIQATKQDQSIFGSGYINWLNNDSSFTIDGESSLLFISVLSFHSEGTIDKEYGISPVLYSEKRFRKPETNTHFHRERNLVSFSASTRSYPRKGGEQDRSSVIWQLAGIGLHDSEKFQPAAQFAVFVAGAHDADTWYFDVAGLEEVDTALGKMSAWHLVRKPRAGSYDQNLDIWLAPQKNWYPVKLRYTEKNGDYLDMSLSEITATPAR